MIFAIIFSVRDFLGCLPFFDQARQDARIVLLMRIRGVPYKISCSSFELLSRRLTVKGCEA